MSAEGPADGTVKKSVFRRAVKVPAQSNEEGGATQAATPVAAVPMTQFAVPVRLPGTKASVFSKNLITSSGLASLDSALGGGLALGTIVCITEDAPSSCHSLLLKHFLAQGLVQGHDTLVAAPNKQLVLPLPAPMQSAPAAQPQTKTSVPKKEGGAELRIAWRYKESLGAKQATSDPDDSFCLKLDMSQSLPEDLTSKLSLVSLSSSSSSSSPHAPATSPHAEARPDGTFASPDGDGRAYAVWNSGLDAVYGEVEAAVVGASNGKRVARVALPSFGSSLWLLAASGAPARGGASGPCNPDWERRAGAALTAFVLRLRGLVRTHSCVVMLTVPPHLANNPHFGQRVERSSDVVVQLKSLTGCPPEVRAQLKEYSATLHLLKPLRLHALTSFTPDVRHYLLRVRRKLLQLDRLQASTPEHAPAGADPLAF